MSIVSGDATVSQVFQSLVYRLVSITDSIICIVSVVYHQSVHH